MKHNKTTLSVSQLNNQAKFLLEKEFSDIWVEGEVSSVRKYSSGHTYFTLKDSFQEISVVFFSQYAQKSSITLQNGEKIIVNGSLSIYAIRGQYQFIAKNIQISGQGNLWLDYEKLKNKLEYEGLFKASRKKQIPSYPHKIGVITSADGAVIQDIINIISRRSPHLKIFLRPSLVQGQKAVKSLINSIDDFCSYESTIDVIIICRGGGSMEDLWCFNDENLVRKIADCKIPIISAIGHETDFTLSDFVSDLRAPTPSAAAELVAPSRDDLYQYLDDREQQLSDSIKSYFEKKYKTIEIHSLSKGFLKPEIFLTNKKERINKLSENLLKNFQFSFEKLKKQSLVNSTKLNALNPDNVMKRGYSLIYSESEKLIDLGVKLQIDDNISIHFSDSVVNAQIRKINKK